ncbi:MAG TPA: hypothetical protein PLZ12_13305 [Saprospiraceae bacterium]|nr:hypothetical protein [Saprospiraceae bacterium]
MRPSAAINLLREIQTISIRIECKIDGYDDMNGFDLYFCSVTGINDLRFKLNKKKQNAAIEAYSTLMEDLYHKFEKGISNFLEVATGNEDILARLEELKSEFIEAQSLFVFPNEYKEYFENNSYYYNKNAQIYGGLHNKEAWVFDADLISPIIKIQKNTLDRAIEFIDIKIKVLSRETGTQVSRPRLIWKENSNLFFILFSVMIRGGYLKKEENNSDSLGEIGPILRSVFNVPITIGSRKEYEPSTFNKYLGTGKWVEIEGNSYEVRNGEKLGETFEKVDLFLKEIIGELEKP